MASRYLLIGALALAMAGCGGDDDESGTDTAQPLPTIETTPTETETVPNTDTGAATTPERPDPKARDVSLAVTSFVEAVEQSDAARACELLGQPARGSDPGAIQACASAAGVSLDRLPSTDELSIESVKASDGTAVVRLSGRSTMRLRRSGRRWRVVAYVPPRVGHP